jgi:hypothetical protein
MDSAALKAQPPCGYDRNNMTFSQAGGPEIFPGAQWETADPVKVYVEIGGDPVALASVLQQHINLFAELTGVLPSRLGAQTVSHTTAYAKQSELQRGATRTVDYVNATGLGPITRWLDMAYRMGRAEMKKSEEVSFFIEAYGGYVNVERDHLPEAVTWQWFGAGGPQENQAKMNNRMQALQMALKMDAMAVQLQKPATINIAGAIKETLREGGWQDIDAITNIAQPAGGAAPAPGLPGPAQGGPASPLAALPPPAGGGG